MNDQAQFQFHLQSMRVTLDRYHTALSEADQTAARIYLEAAAQHAAIISALNLINRRQS